MTAFPFLPSPNVHFSWFHNRKQTDRFPPFLRPSERPVIGSGPAGQERMVVFATSFRFKGWGEPIERPDLEMDQFAWEGALVAAHRYR